MMGDAVTVIGSGLPVERIADIASQHLAAGGLLVHPTSGVYGIGGAATPDVDAAIDRLKGRPEGRPLIGLVSGVEVIEAELPDAAWPPLAVRFAAEFWPGPLTIIVDDGTPHGRSVRCEGHPLTRAVLVRWGRVLSSTSLNRTGQPPLHTSEGIRRFVSALEEVDRPILAIDAGDLAGPPPSTLVRVTAEGWDVLREGAVEASRLQRVASP